MNEFKLGDRVEVTENTDYYSKGDIGTVYRVNNQNDISVKFDGTGEVWWCSQRIKHYNHSPYPANLCSEVPIFAPQPCAVQQPINPQENQTMSTQQVPVLKTTITIDGISISTMSNQELVAKLADLELAIKKLDKSKKSLRKRNLSTDSIDTMITEFDEVIIKTVELLNSK